MTPQELKASILQLAIQGKLVEQRAEEGTAEELYQQIRKEKQRLIKDGFIKKEKSYPTISEDECPYDLPEEWKWVRLQSIVYNRGQMIPNTTFAYIDIGSIDNTKQQLSEQDNVISPEQAPSRARRIVDYGDILYSTVRPYLHNMCIINRVFSHMPIASTGFAAMTCHAGVYNKYLFYYLQSPSFDAYANNTENAKGVAYPAINDDRLYRALIALPPLTEQKRIVAKIEELLPYIDRYEQAWSRLEDFNQRFPVDMQKSILQMAIQGKLVEQRPEEGTGEELYQKIQQEKQRLIKAGTIKKEKPLPEITEDEIPFDIPEGWKWYRIGELFNIVNGFTPLKSNLEFWTDGDIPWFTIDDVHRQGRFISSTEKFITRKALSKNTERIVPADTVLLCCTASVGEYAYTQIPLTTNQQFNAFVVKEHYKNAVYPLYVFEFAKTLKSSLIDRAGKTTFNFVSVGKLSNMLIPLPPLAEQKRIVAKLEEILPLCDRLKWS